MIKDNRRQKLRLLTEWMDYFILENKREIERSMYEDGIVFIYRELTKEMHDVRFSLMVLTNYELSLNVQLKMNTGVSKGQRICFDIQKRDNKYIVVFKDNRNEGEVLTYQLDFLLRYMSHRSLEDLIGFIKEVRTNKESCLVCEKEVEAFTQESIINYYLDKGDFESLKQRFSKDVKTNRGNSK